MSEEKINNNSLPPDTEGSTISPAEPSQAAFTIVIQSWATPILGFVMLIIGLLGGYYGRPLLEAGGNPTVSGQNSSADAVTIPTPDAELATQQQALMKAVVSETRHFKGDSDAPVTIIEFSDFQCPYCGRFATGAGRQIDEQYIQGGLVRFGYVHFAFLGKESQWAGEASECAAEQDAFWEYHNYLFDNQGGETRGDFSKDNLKKFAIDLGLVSDAFNECLDSGRFAGIVQGDTNAARQLGVQSTPTFLINGQPVVGAQPFEVFQQVIEDHLSGD